MTIFGLDVTVQFGVMTVCGPHAAVQSDSSSRGRDFLLIFTPFISFLRRYFSFFIPVSCLLPFFLVFSLSCPILYSLLRLFPHFLSELASVPSSLGSPPRTDVVQVTVGDSRCSRCHGC
jgi:hypothetical protein